MHSQQAVDRTGPSPEALDAYLHLGKADVARLVLCLMIEEALRGQLASLPDAVVVHASRLFGGDRAAS